MLTKDLLRFSRARGQVKPKFLDVQDQRLLDLSKELLSLYDLASASTRGELEDRAATMINAYDDIRLAEGLNKIILDRCEFGGRSDIDYAEARDTLFLASAKAVGTMKYQPYRLHLEQATGLPGEFLEDIYADHPDNEKLLAVDILSPRELLERYNVSLVQSLLLYADRMEVILYDPDPARCRRLFKYLKFFRLLASIRQEQTGQGGPKLRLEVSGPASVLENGRKYGLQLASFFPAVCGMQGWKLHAVLQLPGYGSARQVESTLKLDQTAGLAALYRNFSAYVPEEIRMYHTLFKEKSELWEIAGGTPLIPVGQQELVCPDFSFRHRQTGQVLHLEIFHLWHAGALGRRLDWLEQHPETGLALGVDRKLAPEGSEMLARLEASPYFQKHGFLFRDFPGVARTCETLDRICATPPPAKAPAKAQPKSKAKTQESTCRG